MATKTYRAHDAGKDAFQRAIPEDTVVQDIKELPRFLAEFKRPMPMDLNLLRAELIADKLAKIASFMMQCTRQAALRLADICDRHSVITAVQQFIADAPIVLNESIHYCNAIYLLCKIFAALRGDTIVEDRLWSSLISGWAVMTKQLWDKRHLTIFPDPERHDSHFSILCEFKSTFISRFREVIASESDYTFSLLLKYWRRAVCSGVKQSILTKLLTLIQVDSEPSFEEPFDLNRLRKLSVSIQAEFGPNPGPEIAKVLKAMLSRGQGQCDASHRHKGGHSVAACACFMHALVNTQAQSVVKGHKQYVEALATSPPLWRAYFRSLRKDRSIMENTHSIRITLTPLGKILGSMIDNTDQKKRDILVMGLIKSSFFDYMEASLSIKDASSADAGVIHDCLDGFYQNLQISSPKTCRSIGKRMPRIRLWYLLAKEFLSLSPEVASSQLGREARYNYWVPLMLIQTKVVPLRRCQNRGCMTKGKFECKDCKARYCSKECQKCDWPVHKLICKMIPRVRTMYEFSKWMEMNPGDELPLQMQHADVSP